MMNLSVSGIVFFSIPVVMALESCTNIENHDLDKLSNDTVTIVAPVNDTTIIQSGEVVPAAVSGEMISETVNPDSIVAFARTLIGIPYLYASIDPKKGFDCSGFITYVFNHFNIAVPRSSVDFTNVGQEIVIEKAKPGDLILFTGTDSTVRIVGHMGIVETTSGNKLQFIHSTSGNAKGVVITVFGDYYRSRFVKIIRVFPDEFFQ